MIYICAISICIGTSSLALVAAIMNGFEKETHKKLQGVHADLIIRANDTTLNYSTLRTVLLTEFKENIAAITPTAQHTVMIQSADDTANTHLALLMGIDPFTHPAVSTLDTTRLHKKIPLADALKDNHILIGHSLAQLMKSEAGASAHLLYPEEDAPSYNTLTLDSTETTISDIFNTGIDEWDSSILFCSLSYFMDLFPEAGIAQVGIKLKKQLSPAAEKELISRIQKRLDENLEIISWKDLYPALVSALTLEKYALFCILALITLVASMNIISLLFMYITHKKRDIALLLTLGMPLSTIIYTFMIIGIGIALCAGIVGIGIAALASWFLNSYPIIQLPDVYYVSHLPAHMSWGIVIAVLFTVLIISSIASWIPARRLKSQSLITLLTE